MITKWKLFNFKSIRNETELTLAPLTIFAGSNSSGKSSVLQSMLLIAQTLSSQASARPIVLNGSLVHLGQFDDIRSFNSEAEQIVFGWEVKSRTTNRHHFNTMQAIEARWVEEYDEDYWDEEFGEILTSRGEIAFDADPASPNREIYQLQPRLFSTVLEALLRSIPSELDVRWSAVRSTSESLDKKQSDMKSAQIDLANTALQYDIDFDRATFSALLRRKQRPDYADRVVGCRFDHFLPERLYVSVDDLIGSSIAVHQVFTGRAGFKPESVRTLLRELPEQAWEFLKEKIDAVEVMSFREAVTKLFNTFDAARVEASKLDEGAPRSPVDSKAGRRLFDLDFKERDELDEVGKQHPLMYDLLTNGSDDLAEVNSMVLADEERILVESGGYRYRLEQAPLIAHLRAMTALTKVTFVQMLKYLGPLRDDPKPLYSIQASAAPTDVGLRGEMTAAVLEMNKDAQVEYLPPSIFDEPLQQRRTVVRTLQTAINEWLRYLGIAEAVETSEMGKLGYQMQVVAEEAGKSMDLTHVGVGVSQVLPILVLCLLAEPDTTIILEQPELHLHPKVQTLLADFFLAVSLSGRQIIVETHSEYLINRLRFRAAATATESALHEMIQVYFAEKKSGNSEFRQVVINDYGAIIDWPDGFFDQSQIEAEAILRAATRKRKQKRGDGRDA